MIDEENKAGEASMLKHLAEECTELAHAALKKRGSSGERIRRR